MAVTVAQFRKLALAQPGAVEGAHMGHPDFRVGGKIFASLSGREEISGMVKLSPPEQHAFLKLEPDAYRLASGSWGTHGATMVRLGFANAPSVARALESAWRNVVAGTSTRKKPPRAPRSRKRPRSSTRQNRLDRGLRSEFRSCRPRQARNARRDDELDKAVRRESATTRSPAPAILCWKAARNRMSMRRMNLVSTGAMVRFVRTAIERSLGRPAPGEFAERVTRELVRAIRGAGRPVRGITRREFLDELELANHELVRNRNRVRAELTELERLAELQRAQLHESHDRMLRALGGGAAAREQIALDEVDRLFAQVGRGLLPLAEVHQRVRALALEAARSERRGLVDSLGAERDRQIDQLERRIAKLNRSLELAESALRELAARKDVDPGLESIYRTVQGLSAEAPDSVRKKVMLERIFLANVQLRDSMYPRASIAV